MKRTRHTAAAAIAIATRASTATHGQRHATPELHGFESMPIENGTLEAARAPLPNTTSFVGLGLLCNADGATVMISFGAFPADRRPVQLAVRGALIEIIERNTG